MTAPLKPCPTGCHTDFISMQQVGTRHMIKCDCGWTAPIRANKERAVTAWNTRADAPELVALVEALEKALNFIANTESEMGETLLTGDAARAALAALKGAANE